MSNSSPINSTINRTLSPFKHARDNSSSRPSSRSSLRSNRAHSPSFSIDDPIAVRNQVSTLKHNIRHQQAQLHSLENIILRGPRPYPSELTEDMAAISSSPPQPPPSAFSPVASTSSTTTKMKRRSSFDVLQGIAGPESNLPLPRRENGSGLEDSGIREGIPMSFGITSISPTLYKRVPSPTRTLSRIPVASVGNARALADEGQPATPRPSALSASSSSKLSPLDLEASTSSLNGSTLQPPPSPSRRISLTPGGTTKVLADLQTGVVNARNALENTKAQLRLSQRSVAQLTRQTEDLKEGRERLRLENEGLNNVVARKERLLQEVLERARKAETEAASLKTQLKTETVTSKKTLKDMETALTESTALSQKSEREYITLRDSLKGLTESFKADGERLREEMRKREEKWKTEAEAAGKKYKKLLEEFRNLKAAKEEVQKLEKENSDASKAVEKAWTDEIERLRGVIEGGAKEDELTASTAKNLAGELARLRRLMQSAGRISLTEIASSSQQNAPP